jgi:hypothetical protein
LPAFGLPTTASSSRRAALVGGALLPLALGTRGGRRGRIECVGLVRVRRTLAQDPVEHLLDQFGERRPVGRRDRQGRTEAELVEFGRHVVPRHALGLADGENQTPGGAPQFGRDLGIVRREPGTRVAQEDHGIGFDDGLVRRLAGHLRLDALLGHGLRIRRSG